MVAIDATELEPFDPLELDFVYADLRLRHGNAQQADAAWEYLEQDFERNSQVILAARKEREKLDVYPK